MNERADGRSPHGEDGVHGDDGALGADRARVLAKVRGLLAKAESTTFPHEAESLTAKAQELLSRYRLDEAMAMAADGPSGTRSANAGAPVRRDLTIEQPYATPKFILLSGIARANHCSAVFARGTLVGTVIGYPADVEAVVVLYTSLLLQGTSALLAEGSVRDHAGRSRTRSFRHAFWLSFGHRIGQRLADATEHAEASAAAGAALPVLANRDADVEAAVREQFAHLGSLRTAASNAEGAAAGRAAADRVHLGGRRHLPG